jgi:neutral ceramidase
MVVCAMALLLTAGPMFAQESGRGLRAGGARIDITPSASELAAEHSLLRDRLYVRALTIDDTRTCAVIVGIETGPISNQMIDGAISRAAASTGCPASQFIVASVNCHSCNARGVMGGAPTEKTIADAIVMAATTAKSKLAPARIGYGTDAVHLNVNRDLFNDKQEWRQGPNPDGTSDKTLAVVALVGTDHVPIGVLMNYAMHPINYFMTGVLSSDFPGEASRYFEEYFDDRTVAIFTQGALGDQNPLFQQPVPASIRTGAGPFRETIGTPPPGASTPSSQPRTSSSPGRASTIPPENLDAFKKAVDRTGANVRMMGTLIAADTIRLMRSTITPEDNARIWGAWDTVTCPGRDRLPDVNPGFDNVQPAYRDGADVEMRVDLLRIGDIHFVTVNGELYSRISQHLKAAAPAAKTIVVNGNGQANSGYVYSDDASYHLTFQVIGSRLKPGCAEGKIVSKAIELMSKSDR